MAENSSTSAPVDMEQKRKDLAQLGWELKVSEAEFQKARSAELGIAFLNLGLRKIMQIAILKRDEGYVLAQSPSTGARTTKTLTEPYRDPAELLEFLLTNFIK